MEHGLLNTIQNLNDQAEWHTGSKDAVLPFLTLWMLLPHTQSFGEDQAVNTGIIANKICKEALASEKFDFRINTQNKSYINYSAQYNETHYNYLAGTAEAYGEQFYYDSEILHFGKLPPEEKLIRLVYGSNASDVPVELNAVHTNLIHLKHMS